jgi:putative tricarboxylic transport membrane protein
MNEAEKSSGRGPSTRTMDMVVAVILMTIGGVVIWDSQRIGAAWGESGPESGYFPFYIGLLIIASSAITLGTAIVKRGAKREVFVDASSFVLVLKVLVPAAVFVALTGVIGIYVSAALFIGFFMWWLGRYPLHTILPISIGVPLALFVVFEIWFLLPLPKGPLESYLGY